MPAVPSAPSVTWRVLCASASFGVRGLMLSRRLTGSESSVQQLALCWPQSPLSLTTLGKKVAELRGAQGRGSTAVRRLVEFGEGEGGIGQSAYGVSLSLACLARAGLPREAGQRDAATFTSHTYWLASLYLIASFELRGGPSTVYR